MIPARKNALVDWLMFQGLLRVMRKRFYAVLVRGAENLRSLDLDKPVLAFSNHVNWWDGLVVFLLTRQAPHKSFYCMMEEKNLKHYRFLTRLGAFSVDLENKLHAAVAIRHTVRLLQKPSSLVWVFPQGELKSPYEPIDFQRGVHFLAQHTAGARLLPVAVRYEFMREDRPHVLIEIGKPLAAEKTDLDGMQAACRQAFQRLRVSVETNRLEGFESILPPLLSINKQWLWLKLALTGRLKEFQPTH